MTGFFARPVLAIALAVSPISMAKAETPLADHGKVVADMEAILALPAKTAAAKQALSGAHLANIGMRFTCKTDCLFDWLCFGKFTYSGSVSFTPAQIKLRSMVDLIDAEAAAFLETANPALHRWRETVEATEQDFGAAAEILSEARKAGGSPSAVQRARFRSSVRSIQASLKESAAALGELQMEMAKFTLLQEARAKGLVDWENKMEQSVVTIAGKMSEALSEFPCKGNGPQQLETGRQAALDTLRTVSQHITALASDASAAEAAGRRLSGAVETLVAQYDGVAKAMDNAEGSEFASLVQKIRFDTSRRMFSDLAGLAR